MISNKIRILLLSILTKRHLDTVERSQSIKTNNRCIQLTTKTTKLNQISEKKNPKHEYKAIISSKIKILL